MPSCALESERFDYIIKLYIEFDYNKLYFVVLLHF